jgi:hypothetical protein
LALYAQSSAQAAEELVFQSERRGTKKIKAGARIKVYGPPGTLPVSGKLVAAGDTLEVRRSGSRGTVKLPMDNVTAVRRVIPVLIVLGIYMLIQTLLGIGGVILIGLLYGGTSVALAAFLVGFLGSIPYIVLTVVFFYYGMRKYGLPKWRIKRPDRP